MDYASIFHRPMSEYAGAVDDTHYLFRLRCKRNDIRNCTFWFADRAEMAPTLTFSPALMNKVRCDKYYDYFEVLIETTFLRIAYYFEIDDGTEKTFYLGDCFSKTPDVERYEFFQLPFNLRSDRVIIPDWVREAVVYNIFPDSFANGKRKIEDAESLAEYQGEICRSLHGGTIKGIEENLDYIRNLGCNCVYLNPFFAASSYHKYDLLDYYHVDPTRGTDEDFRSLVETAHSKGIRVIIDGVFNHVCYRHPFFKDVLEKGKNSEFYDYFYELPEHPAYPEGGEEPGYLCFAYVPEMPKTNTANRKLRDYFCDVGAYWIREFDVDGWRLDVANEVDDQFLRAFRNSVKEAKEDALVIGEVWENANHYINGSMMDSAMNYDFRRFCGQFFANRNIDSAEFDARVSNLLMRYPQQATYAQLNLLDSHDVSRFLTVCGGDRDRMELAILFQMTFVGMPSIFYGDEKGLEGEKEPEYRRPMEFCKEDRLEEVYKSFIALRKSHPCFMNGKYETVLVNENTYGYRRSDDTETVTVYMNNGEKTLPLKLSGRIIISKNYEDGKLFENGYVVTTEE
ncbi:glycoside hydrolase family 13 protein [Butyrivibrio sp. YAB3001]|uniref:glycoside hydrolase family 13 protein n=1 Tax=Butyrivibrio sp. YAB3001 TaxID=1520812 RepID=UPI0008F670CB|nr:glycoside hydrolase family 13 protein [Butyrivibrio sp. YAB3001]SFC50580.1 Glycosidase [Butyrivibrio sp. YAB3001]